MYNRPNNFYDSYNFYPAKVYLLIFPHSMDYEVKCMLKSILVDKDFQRQPTGCLGWKSIWPIWNFNYPGSCNHDVPIWSIHVPRSFICLHNSIINQCKDKYTTILYQQIPSLYSMYSCLGLVVLIIWVVVQIKRPLSDQIISDWH